MNQAIQNATPCCTRPCRPAGNLSDPSVAVTPSRTPAIPPHKNGAIRSYPELFGVKKTPPAKKAPSDPILASPSNSSMFDQIRLNSTNFLLDRPRRQADMKLARRRIAPRRPKASPIYFQVGQHLSMLPCYTLPKNIAMIRRHQINPLNPINPVNSLSCT
jgi:hypothetical protein